MHFLDPTELIKSFGLIGIAGIILFESGIPFGFFLPGASLLFTAGILASLGFFDIKILIISTFIAAIIGDGIGFYTGWKLGDIFFQKERWFIKQKHINQTRHFFNTHGKKAIILARFMPIIRTFTPILAGISKMNVQDFFVYNVIGAAIWTGGTISLAYFLGNHIPNLQQYMIPIALGIIFITFIPVVLELRKAKKEGLEK